MPKTTEGPSYCDPVGSANLGRNHLFPFRSRCLKRNITDIPLHKVAWRFQPHNPRADQHWQRLRCNASANLICTFVMPAIRLIDTRHGSHNRRYVRWCGSLQPVCQFDSFDHSTVNRCAQPATECPKMLHFDPCLLLLWACAAPGRSILRTRSATIIPGYWWRAARTP